MAKKIIAILLALTFVFAFAACKGKDDSDTTTTTTDPFEAFGNEEETSAEDLTSDTEVTTLADESTTAADESTTAASSEASSTQAASESTSASTTATTKAASKAPQTKEEIVAYFNTAINSAKKDSKSIKSNFMKHSVAGEVTGVPGMIDTVLGGTGNFINGFMGEDDSKSNVTWTSAADKNAYFPVETETWASKLTVADVKDAKIKESNGKYMIQITTLADGQMSSVKHGEGHNPKAFNVVMPEVVSDNVPGAVAKIFSIGTISMSYPSSTIVVTIDAATGHVLTANYKMNWTIHIPLGDNNVVLPFMTENDYVINW